MSSEDPEVLEWLTEPISFYQDEYHVPGEAVIAISADRKKEQLIAEYQAQGYKDYDAILMATQWILDNGGTQATFKQEVTYHPDYGPQPH